jgi:hypothetical protein
MPGERRSATAWVLTLVMVALVLLSLAKTCEGEAGRTQYIWGWKVERQPTMLQVEHLSMWRRQTSRLWHIWGINTQHLGPAHPLGKVPP